MIAPISLGRAHGKGAARASPTPSRKLEGQIRILGDAFQPTYDQCAVAGHHGVAGALWCGGFATERSKSFGPNLF
jgi:hypothetical protein